MTDCRICGHPADVHGVDASWVDYRWSLSTSGASWPAEIVRAVVCYSCPGELCQGRPKVGDR